MKVLLALGVLVIAAVTVPYAILLHHIRRNADRDRGRY